MNKIIDFELNETIDKEDKILEIEELCKNGMPISEEDVEILLRNLSYIVRKKIADYEGKNMREYSYSYKCDLAQSMICYYLKKLNIKTNPINTNEVMNGVTGHSLVITNINTVDKEKTYLIDPTYIQFFEKENCDSSKFVIIKNQVCISPDPGYFIVENHTEDVIRPLLENGYIEWTDEVAKAYGDSFFQTKQGTAPDQIKNNVASGSNYIRWFQRYISPLSKSEETLRNMNLLIETTGENTKSNHL